MSALAAARTERLVTCVSAAVVDVVQDVRKHMNPRGWPGGTDSVCEGGGRRPADVEHGGAGGPAVAEARQPVPAVGSRAKDEVVSAQRCQCRSEVTGLQVRNVAADDQRWSRLTAGHPAHPHAQIACTLRHDRDAKGSRHGAARTIRRDRQDRAPGAIGRKATKQPGERRAVEAQGFHPADIGGKPRLYGADHRLTGEHKDSRP
ncbi:MAG: hypothetical protein OXG57_03550 [Acidimicrobiaceae bacterium]|nr:hypothetical protein [Acidimicrobiaceae bacterium]